MKFAECKTFFNVEGNNYRDAGKASMEIKKTLKALGIADDILRRTAIAAYEAELNIISYAKKGIMVLYVASEHILIDVEDEGPGIEDIEMAMRQGYSTASDYVREMGFGAGMGLFNIQSCSDDFEITSEVNKGTHLKILIRLPERKKQ